MERRLEESRAPCYSSLNQPTSFSAAWAYASLMTGSSQVCSVGATWACSSRTLLSPLPTSTCTKDTMVSTYSRSRTCDNRIKVDLGKDKESAGSQKAVSMVCFSSILVGDIVAGSSTYHDELSYRPSGWPVRGRQGMGGQVVHED